QVRRFLRGRGRHLGQRAHVAARALDDRVSRRGGRRPRRRHVHADLQDGDARQVVILVESTRLLRAFAWTRLGLAGLLLVTIPLTASEFAPVANAPILALALIVTAGSSAAILLRRAAPDPRRVAALISTLDVVLITAVGTATGGPRSI